MLRVAVAERRAGDGESQEASIDEWAREGDAGEEAGT